MRIPLSKIIFILSIVSLYNCTLPRYFYDFVKFNLVGHPAIHKITIWNFDPEIGIIRSREYQKLNGKWGEKLIERLGLGIDGYDKERLIQQRARDEGHLNGVDE